VRFGVLLHRSRPSRAPIDVIGARRGRVNETATQPAQLHRSGADRRDLAVHQFKTKASIAARD
jgi:hypothetical protein